MNSLSRDYIELIFSFSRKRPVLAASIISFLKACGIRRDEIVETAADGRDEVRLYLTSHAKAKRLAAAVRKQRWNSVSFRLNPLPAKAWAEKWKEDFNIQKMGRRFVVVPAWRQKEFRPEKFPKRIPVVIDPLSAFGSGEHETTQLIVRMMEMLRGKYKTFLDAGCGTGILSIAAIHLGAEKAVGFDNDKPSAECARFNFKKNGFTSGGEFRCLELARLAASPKFDLVCANINSHILEKYRAQITAAAKHGGHVLVCGILKQTYASFRQEFDGRGLRCVKVLRGRRWVSVLYRKN